MENGVDQFIQKAKIWKEEMSLLRTILLSCKLTESIKWGQPCYTVDNKNIVMLQSFKQHCGIGFFNGAGLKDEKGLLVKAGEHTQSSRQMRFTNLSEINRLKTTIKLYVQEAIANEKDSSKLKPNEGPATIVVEELNERLKKDKALKKAYEALTPGRQRAYLIFFSGAKQAATRISRIDKYVGSILAGRGINDCTCGLSKKMPYCDGSHKQLPNFNRSHS